jgi:hypothetical protein
MLKRLKQLEYQLPILILVGFGIIFLLPSAFRETYCTSSKELQHTAAGDAQPSSSEQHGGQVTGTPLFVLSGVHATSQSRPSDTPSVQPTNPQSWFCDLKLTDVALVFFTYCLAVVGWATMRNDARNVRDLERATLFAGPAATANGVIINPGGTAVHVSVTNYGRSPGMLKELFAEFSTTEPMGDKCVYGKGIGGKKISLDVVVLPDATARTITQDDQRFRSPASGEQYFIGYARYYDFFRVWHTNRWCVKIIPTPNVHWEVAGSPAWNDWD